jgi:membrane associated rhomboid family serine protease
VFPYLTVSTVVFLTWAYVVQLVLSWPFTWLLPPSLPLESSLSESLGRHLGWLSPAEVLAGEWWRLLSAAMLHGSVLHVFGNCFVLYILGRTVENAYGRSAFISIFVFSGMVGSGLSLVTGVEASLGASGAVLGLLGAALALGIRHRERIPRALLDYFRLDLWVFVILVAAMSALPFVDWAGHLGGFLAGLGIGMLWPPILLPGVQVGGGRILGKAVAGVAVALVLLTVFEVGLRVQTVSEETVVEDLRSLQAAVERDDKAAQRLIVLRIVENAPRGAGDLWGMLLLDVGEYERALEILTDVEKRNPALANNPPPYWDNNLAWATFMAWGEQPQQVDAGLKRVRRALKEVGNDPVVRNTLAYGLYLDGQPRNAERVISEVMLSKPEEEHGSDIYIHILALLGMGESERAMTQYRSAREQFPKGDLREQAEQALRAEGLLP